MEQFFLAIYFAGIIAEMLIRIPYDRRRRKTRRPYREITAVEYTVLLALWLGMFLLPLMWGITPWLDFANYNWPPVLSNPAGSAGIVLLSTAIGLFWRAHRDLGLNWSPSLELRDQHQLITHGIYGQIRHPMYASQALWSVAQILLVQNWIAGPASLAAYLLLYYVRIPAEERMMLQHFGDEYRAYCQHTGRILPSLCERRSK